jgi:hypothetical protein
MKKLLVLVLSSGILSGCSSVTVNRDFDPTTDFRQLKTFAWQHGQQPDAEIHHGLY